ncbi:MAG: hypothetical protein SGBAC_001058 [Bacillariaceae sp.]
MRTKITIFASCALVIILLVMFMPSDPPKESEPASYLRNGGAKETPSENLQITTPSYSPAIEVPSEEVEDSNTAPLRDTTEVQWFSEDALEDITSTAPENEPKDAEVFQEDTSPKLKIVVYETSKISTSLETLLFVAEKYGIDTTIVGQGTTFSGFGSKYAQLKDTLDELNEDKSSIVALIDGRDVLLNVASHVGYDAFHIQVKQFIKIFKDLTEGKPDAVLISGEQQCCVSALCYADSPDYYFDAETGARKKRACPSGNEGCMWLDNDNVRYWESTMVSEARARSGSNNASPYLNAGMMVGTPQNLINLIHRLDLGEEEDDQAVLSAMYLQFPDLIVLDYEQQLLGNNAWPRGMESGCIFDFDPNLQDNAFLKNKETGTTPLLLHTPGKFYSCLDVLIDRLGGVSDHRYLQVQDNANYGNYGNDGNYGNYDNYGNYGSSNYGNYGSAAAGNYGSSNYGGSNYGHANYGQVNYGALNYGNANYGGLSGNSNHGGGSNYGGSNSGGSNYGGSNYGGFNYGGFNYGETLPTVAPTTPSPTAAPTESPTHVPTNAPTASPASETSSPATSSPPPISGSNYGVFNYGETLPTVAPTPSPTAAPTDGPTLVPPKAPTDSPTSEPTSPAPSSPPPTSGSNYGETLPTVAPTPSPTAAPTDGPTLVPTKAPTDSPTSEPTSPAPSPPPTSLEELCEGSPFKGCCLAGNEICCDVCTANVAVPAPIKAPTPMPTTNPTMEPTVVPTVAQISSSNLATSSPAPTSSPTSDCSECTTMMCDMTRVIWGC